MSTITSGISGGIGFTVDITDTMTPAIGQIESALTDPMNGPLRNWFFQARDEYLNYTRERYIGASHGDGTWVDIARSTKLARLRRAGVTVARGAPINGVLFEILIDTGAMFDSLEQGGPNYVEMERSDGIEFGSIDEKIRYHQEGTDRMPQRVIFVDPPAPVISTMETLLDSSLQNFLNTL